MSETDAHFQALFDRSAAYAVLLTSLAQWHATLMDSTEAQAQRVLQQLRRDYEGLVTIDYFAGAAQAQSAQALAEAEVTFTRHFVPDEPLPLHPGIRQLDPAAYRGKQWATRHRIWVDRVASAWLIRRFIDPDARFLWLSTPQACPAAAIGFDFDGAPFTHTEHRVTFEVLVASFGLDTQPALTRLGRLVHTLDVGGVPVPEAAGFEAILTGVRASGVPDDQILTTMMPVLDALYTTFAQETSSPGMPLQEPVADKGR